MKAVIKKIGAVFFTLLLCALFASCNGLFSSRDSSSNDAPKNQKVRVSFSLKDIASREIRPNNMTFEDVVKIVLYAKKKTGNEYKDYIFEGGDSSKEWRTTVQAETSVLAYNAMASDTVLLEVGTYNFTLELYTLYSSNNTNEHLAQVATKNDFEITASTTSIDLGTASFADTGCLSVTLRWDADENDQSRVSKVEAGLFTLESNGVEPAVYDENTNYDFEIITTYFDSTNNPDGKNTYYGEYAQNEVKNGTYILKYRFYSKAGDEEKLINTVTEIVKIKGFKTEKEIFIDLKKLNVFYNIEYNLMGGTWKNSEDYRAGERTRNAYTAEILPNVEDMIPPSGKNTFVGWYTDENFTEESLVTDIGAGEDYARDYTLYARWISSNLYVSSTGLSTNDGFSVDTPVNSVGAALSIIENQILPLDNSQDDYPEGVSPFDWTINICGEVNCVEVLNLTKAHAKSLTITGYHENTEDNYIDILNGGSTYAENKDDAVIADSIFTIYSSCVPVTIKNLKLTNGISKRGYGGAIDNMGNLTLDSGAWLDKNHTYYAGGAIMNNASANLIIKSGVRITENSSGEGGAIRNAGHLDIQGGEFSGNTAGRGAAITLDGTLKLSGHPTFSSVEGAVQDIHLSAASPFTAYYVTVSDDFSSRVVLTFGSISEYTDKVVLKPEEGSSLTSGMIEKFTLLVSEGDGIIYYIDESGKFSYKASTANGSHISSDNRLLNISVSSTSLSNFAGSLISFGVKEPDGSAVTDNVTYTAELLYKGSDVNTMASSENPYYSLSGNILTLNKPLPKVQNYQLYVTASRYINERTAESVKVTSSQTFDIDVSQSLPYVVTAQKYDQNSSATYTEFYLVNSTEEKLSALTPVIDISAMLDNSSIIDYALDKNANLYVMNKYYSSSAASYVSTITTTNPKFDDHDHEVIITNLNNYEKSDHGDAYTGFSIDFDKNVFYAYGNQVESINDTDDFKRTTQFDVYKYPSFIDNADLTDSIHYEIKIETYIPVRAVVNNGILYCLAEKANAAKAYVMLTFGLTEEDQTYEVYDGEVVDLTSGLNLSSYAECNYMTFQDGKIYITIAEANVGQAPDTEDHAEYEYDFYSRGILIEYDTENRSIRKTGLSGNVISNEDFAMYLGDSGGLLYSTDEIEDGYTTPPRMKLDRSFEVTYDGETVGMNYFFPTVHAPKNLNQKEFVTPGKIIAIKPKTLVMLDTGTFVYVNDDGALGYKKVNRTVTVDLENFVIESMSAISGNTNSSGGSSTEQRISVLYLGNIGVVSSLPSNSDALPYCYNNYSEKYESTEWSNSMYLYIKDETED